MAVLIIEDDQDEAFVLHTILYQQLVIQNMPAQCYTITDCRQISVWLEQQPAQSIYLVIIDHMLGHEEDGLQWLGRLRQHPALHSTAALILRSGYDTAELVSASRAAGADAFISKQRITPTTGREILDIAKWLWKADQQHQQRPWIALH